MAVNVVPRYYYLLLHNEICNREQDEISIYHYNNFKTSKIVLKVDIFKKKNLNREKW